MATLLDNEASVKKGKNYLAEIMANKQTIKSC